MNPKPLLIAAALAFQAWAVPAAAQETGLITGRTEIIAHRGGPGPDGTIAGVGRSLAAGIRYIELDVRLTSDGQAIILHDPSVDRTTDGSGAVATMTLEQVRKLDAGAKYRDPAEPEKSYEGERIPTAQEMIHFIGARGILLLELKVADAAEPVVAAVRTEQAFNRVIVRSADKKVLQSLKALDARIRVGTMGKMPEENLAAFLEELQALGVVSFTAPAADRVQVDAFRSKGIAVWGSNTNDPAVMSALIEAKVDGIITDDVPALAALLKEQQPAEPPATEEGSRTGTRTSFRTGLWKIPDFKATLASGTREFSSDALLDLGLDFSFDVGPLFAQLSADYAFSGQLEILSGSAQVGIEASLGELLLPLSLRGSAGVLVGQLTLDEARFGDFKAGVGFLARVELLGRISETVTTSLWVDFRQVSFDFEPTVIGGDDAAGGATFAVGLSLGIRF